MFWWFRYDASPTQKDCIAHANSSDGIHWGEAALGLVNVTTAGGKRSTENNCVVEANGLGVYRDPTEAPGSPALFKASLLLFLAAASPADPIVLLPN